MGIFARQRSENGRQSVSLAESEPAPRKRIKRRRRKQTTRGTGRRGALQSGGSLPSVPAILLERLCAAGGWFSVFERGIGKGESPEGEASSLPTWAGRSAQSNFPADRGKPEPHGRGLSLPRSGQFTTLTATVAVCVTPPPVPVTVMVRPPSRAREPAFMVMVELPEPGAAMELGLKLTVTLLPIPEADKPTAELKPPEMVVVMVAVCEPPLATLTELGEAPMVKFGEAPVTVSDTVVVSVVLPEVPWTVIV